MAEDDFGIILVKQTEMNNRVAKEQQKSSVIELYSQTRALNMMPNFLHSFLKDLIQKGGSIKRGSHQWVSKIQQPLHQSSHGEYCPQLLPQTPFAPFNINLITNQKTPMVTHQTLQAH